MTITDDGVSVTTWRRPTEGLWTLRATHYAEDPPRSVFFEVRPDLPTYAWLAHGRKALGLPLGPNSEDLIEMEPAQ
jgi:hypothetical protein